MIGGIPAVHYPWMTSCDPGPQSEASCHTIRAQPCNARWGNGAAEAEARPAPAAGVSTFFRLRQDHLVAPAVLPPVSCARLTIATLRAHAARPLLTGFRSTYAITEPSCFSVRIHRSKYSLCQNASPVLPSRLLARFAVAAFNHRMISGSERIDFTTT